MSYAADTTKNMPFVRRLEVEKLGIKPFLIEWRATEEECAKLTTFFGNVEILSLHADVRVQAMRSKDLVEAHVHLRASVLQPCRRTRVPVTQSLDEQFVAQFSSQDTSEEDSDAFAEELSVDIASDGALDQFCVIDKIENGVIDIGEVITQHLSVSVDPYPKFEGEVPVETPEGGRNWRLSDDGVGTSNRPFSGLKDMLSTQKI